VAADSEGTPGNEVNGEALIDGSCLPRSVLRSDEAFRFLGAILASSLLRKSKCTKGLPLPGVTMVRWSEARMQRRQHLLLAGAYPKAAACKDLRQSCLTFGETEVPSLLT